MISSIKMTWGLVSEISGVHVHWLKRSMVPLSNADGGKMLKQRVAGCMLVLALPALQRSFNSRSLQTLQKAISI
jgi:hypothetical protein